MGTNGHPRGPGTHLYEMLPAPIDILASPAPVIDGAAAAAGPGPGPAAPPRRLADDLLRVISRWKRLLPGGLAEVAAAGGRVDAPASCSCAGTSSERAVEL